MERILGVDPGLASTGLGVIEYDGVRWRLLSSAHVLSKAEMPLAERLARIHGLVSGAIERYRPEVMVVESLFFAKNVRSAVLMAHGRGAAILAAGQAGIPVEEYAPREIKQSILGSGDASKEQIQAMVQRLLQLPAPPANDHEADALACALAHAFRTRVAQTARLMARESPGAPLDGAKALLAMRRSGRRRR